MKKIIAILISVVVFAFIGNSLYSKEVLGASPYLRINQGGTGTSTSPTAGTIFFGDEAGNWEYAKFLAGTNITISTTTRSVTISSSGGTGVFEWTPYADGVSTSTLLRFDAGFISNASSTAQNLQLQNLFASSTLAVDGLATFGSSGVTISGNVAIASTSPWGKLSVEMDTTNPTFVVSNQGSTTPAFYIGGVNQNGNIGIGTTTPLNRLSIVGGSLSQVGGDGMNTYSPLVVGGIDAGQTINKIYVSDGYAYAVFQTYTGGNEFYIYDISNVSSIATTSGVELGTKGRDVFVAGKYAYVVKDNAGPAGIVEDFLIYDISNPYIISTTSAIDIGANVTSVTVAGKYAYIGTSAGVSGDDIIIYDISNPQNPTKVGGIENGIGAVKMTVWNKYLYTVTAANSAGVEFRIYDISNPTAPIALDGIELGIGALDLYAQDKYAFVTKSNLGIAADFIIYDVSNPTAIATSSAINLSSAGAGVYVSGRYAYVVRSVVGNDLLVYDILNPSTPVLIGGVDLGGGNTLFFSGRYAYIGLTTLVGNELQVVDVSGMEAQTGFIHSLETGTLQVRNNLLVQGYGQFNSLTTGFGGIYSAGPLGVSLTATTSLTVATFMGGNVGIGTTSPYTSLAVAGSTGVLANLFTATSTTATSTFAGFLNVTGTNSTSTFSGGLTTNAFAVTGNASSTFANGITAAGNLNLATNGVYLINNALVLSANTLGSSVVNSSLTSVGALASGSIGGSFGAINIGSNALTAGVGSFTSLSASNSSATSTFAGGLAIATNGLVYDLSTTNVGIGTAAPIHKLEINGGLGYQRTISNRTASFTATANQSGTLFTNAGTAGTVTTTLPAATTGLVYEFYVASTSDFAITAGAGDRLRIGNSSTTIAGSFRSATEGNMLRLVAVSTFEWVANFVIGSWDQF